MRVTNLVCIAATLPMLLIATSAQAEVSANVALTTDYVWRGVSQNQEDPALQGGFDYGHDSGFYAGVWGSNVSFGGASTELDLYAGWATELDNGLGVDVGYIKYTYHGSDAAGDNDFDEAYIGFSYSGFGATYSIGDEFDDHWEIGYEHSLGSVDISANYGDYDAYGYYKLGIAGELEGLGWAVDFWSNDNDGERIFGDDADSRVVFTLSKEF